MDKFLISGLTGFFGTNWFYNEKNKKKVYYFYNKTKLKYLKKENYLKLNDKKIKKKVLAIKPNFFIHAAGLTDLDKCHSNKKECYKINYKLTKKIVSLAKIVNAKIVFISSDSLSNGKNSFFKENQVSKTLNYYSYCKLKSEKFIKKNYKNHLIIRTNFFGYAPNNRKSFLDFVINNLYKKNKIYLYDNVYFTPISISNLIRFIKELLEKNAKGTFNICGNERISKYQFGLKIAKIFNFNKKLIIRSKIKQMSFFRPLDMSLSNIKLKKFLKYKESNTIKEELKFLKKIYKKNEYYKIKNSLNI